MSVRYTATWYDAMQARQQDTHHTQTHQYRSYSWELGQRVRWCQNGGALCCDLQQLIVYRLLVRLSL